MTLSQEFDNPWQHKIPFQSCISCIPDLSNVLLCCHLSEDGHFRSHAWLPRLLVMQQPDVYCMLSIVNDKPYNCCL